jgi:hypothetical protein
LAIRSGALVKHFVVLLNAKFKLELEHLVVEVSVTEKLKLSI